MKKSFFYLTAGLALILATACQKNSNVTPDPVTETIEVSINANETYQYALPSTGDNTSFNVEVASARSATSSIVSDANGSTFNYTPVTNSTGTDVVVITTVPTQGPGAGCGHHHHHPDSLKAGGNGGSCAGNGGGKHHHKHRHKGKCSNTGEGKHTITFNITVNGTQN